MKSLLVFALLLLAANGAFAQPDARDSVILESKSVMPGAGPGYLTVKVWITNKDSLTVVSLSLVERDPGFSNFCRPYFTLAHPRTFDGVVNRITAALNGPSSSDFSDYNGSSRDSFRIAAGFEPGDPASIEPPNSTRKLIWEIKFDTVFDNYGTVELDTAYVSAPTSFVSTVPGNIPVNFVKSSIVVGTPEKGDLNLNCTVSPGDAVLELSCVFGGTPPAGGFDVCDLNCDSQISPADAVVMLNYVFLGMNWPC